MKHVFACALMLGFWTITTAQTAYKPVVTEQQTAMSQQEPSYPIAGSPKLDADWEVIWPVLEAYARSHPQQLRKTTAWNFAVGQKYTWWASDLSAAKTYEYQVPSTCKAVGTNCYIFVEDALWNNGRVNQSAVDAMKTAFDSSTPADPTKGIYQLDTQYFGNPPNVDGDPRIIILILDIKDGYSGSGAYTAGYFYSLNEYSEASAQSSGSNRHSNYGEIYYIDGNPGDLRTISGITTASSTTAHEFQHMIHWNYDRYEVTFVNEGISESASALCGYSLDSPSRYYANPNISFLSWRTTSDVLQDYSRAAIFTWYLVEQFGSGVTKEIVQSTATGIAGYNAAFSKMGSGSTFNDMLKSFAVANALKDKTVDPQYGFTLPITSKITPAKTYLDPNVSSQSQSVEAQGTVYLLYKGGKNLSATFSGQYSTINVRAIATGSGGKKVTDIPLSSQYSEPGFGVLYDQVIFAVTNLSSAAASFSYSSSGQSAGPLEIAYEDGVPDGYLQWTTPDTAVVWFDAVPGMVLDSIRVAFRRDGSIGFGIWKYSGASRPSPLGKNYGVTTLNITGSPNIPIPYPVPYPNWRTIDVSSWNVDLSNAFAVGFAFGNSPTAPGLMTSTEPYTQPHHSYTNSISASVRNWYVFVSNSAGDSAYAYVVRAYVHTKAETVPSTPVLTSPPHQSTAVSTLPTLIWNASSGADAYRLQVSTSSSFATTVVDDSTVIGTSRQIGPLSNNALYYWRVNAANTGGWGQYSSVWNFTTIVTAPGVPSLIAPVNGATSVPMTPTLTWNAVTGATYYHLQISTSAAFTSTVLDKDSITAPTFAVTGLLAGTPYYWRVNAKNVGGTSAFSTSQSFTTIVAAPAVPVLVTPADLTTGVSTNPTLSWTSAVGATTYRVQLSTSQTFATTLVDDSTVTGTTKAITGLSNSTNYYWRVSASNAGGTSAFSIIRGFTTVIAAPSAPLLISPVDNATGVAITTTLSWSASTGAATYRVQVSTSQTFANTVFDDSTVTAATVIIGSLGNNTTYYWRVNAKNAGGTSPFSTAFSFSTIVAPPATPTLAAPADSTINLPLNTTVSWIAVTGATAYHLQVSTSSSFTGNVVDDTTITSLTKAIGPLSLASTYYWRVRAKNAGGFGAFSLVRSFKTIRTTAVEQLSNGIPTEYSLSQNYPNPFNPSTTIQFSLPKGSQVSLKVFDLLGKEVAMLVSQELGPGYFLVRWQADVPSGTYIYRLQAGEFVETKKMILLR